MVVFVFTAMSGWLAALLIGTNASLPFLMRATQGVAGLPTLRFRLHYALGVVIPVAALLHAWPSMSTGRMGSFNKAGLFVATAALFVIVYQVGLGVSLYAAKGAARRPVRRAHFWTMALIVLLVTGHIVLNR
jgi:cytochrome b561